LRPQRYSTSADGQIANAGQIAAFLGHAPLAALHALAALYHHFVRRDGVLVRMLLGGTE
jgi:cytochrome b561